ncbi:MAG TPA: nitrate reductase cytochrome c-type subunit [Rhodocyclaceae bacterium]|jgi:nitrate reductase (cytochrome), electron transfer subunit|nr:nitrate reductase cytochrome c-type subunit [Rhodocyclaceae bacterium]HRQ48384.1 nitrate reductase cytochrome c-type subunit [Rhodocyclaceae bacterium]
MNRKTRNLAFALAVALGLGVFVTSQATAQTVKSVRGVDVGAAEPAPGEYRLLPDGPPVPRDYVQQPPVVPHKVDGYEVTMNFNKCMDCHSWSRHREEGATKVSLTHFKDRDGGELSNISPRRYFCLQCHVPQTDARPLVENRFQPATGLR